MTAPLALVTGGSGFLGRRLLPRLAARGLRLRALVRSDAAAAAVAAAGAEPVRGDVTEPATLLPAVRGADLVFHLAGVVSPDAALCRRVNAGGTANLVRAVADAAPGLTRFVHVSSRAAVGPSPDGAPLSEATPPRPRTDYGESKRAAERVLETAPGLPYTAIRPPLLYGPGDRVTIALLRLAAAGLFVRFAGGLAATDLLHAGDAARAVALAGDRPGLVGRKILLAGPEPVTPGRLRAALEAAVGRRLAVLALPASLVAGAADALAPLVGRRSAREVAHPRTDADPGEARAALGFRAEVPLPEGLREAFEDAVRRGLIRRR